MTKKKEQEKTLSLYEKLLEIRKGVEFIQKSSSGFKFKYADETAILAAIRPKMDELGVLLEMDMLPPELKDLALTQVGFKFTWVNVENSEEKIEKHIYLQTVPGDPQKMGGLMTYAMRYFLYKNLNVPTADMDIDSYESMTGKLNKDQVNYVEQMINGDDTLRQKIYNWLGVTKTSEIPGSKYQALVNALNSHKNREGEQQ